MSAESKTRMTEGSISRKIILFAIPLFLGNLFQQLYNTADSLIVGNFLGSNALAAVSSSGNLIFLMVGFINGIAMGAGVVIARYYGAKNREDLQKVIHTTVAFGLAAGLALTAIGMYLAPKILVLMGTPSDVLPQSVEYFRTYFAGSLGFVMYNIFVGILQSVGDSRHPLIYLILSSCINVVLDLFFIAGLGMGVGAAALATVISQFTSAILCLIHLMRTKEEYQLHISKIRFDGRVLGEIIRNGVPSGFQNSVISIANVCADQHQRLRKDGDGRLRFVCKNRGLCVPSGYVLYDGADDICQSEPWCKAVRPCEKRCAVRHPLFHHYCRADRSCDLYSSADPDRGIQQRSRSRSLWCDAGENDCTVLLPAGVFSLYRGRTPRFRKRIDPDARHALCLVPVPRQLHHGDGPSDPGYPRDLLGVPADLEHQFCHFPVSVPARKMGLRF